MSDTPLPGLRVLVGAASFADAQAALRVVEVLPDIFCTDLGGMLVEEETLEVCQIPTQRVIQPSGTTMPAPSLTQLRTLIQADARAFRHSLARAADQTGMQWTFAQERGELVHASLHAAVSWDALILGYRQVHKRKGKIVVFGSIGSGDGAKDVIADELLDQLHADRLYVTVDEAPAKATADVVPFASLDDSLRALARMNVEVVVVDLRQGPVQNQRDLARVLEASRCPVIVFGAAATKGQLAHSMQISPLASG